MCHNVNEMLQGGQTRLVLCQEQAVPRQSGNVDVRISVRICHLDLGVLVQRREETDEKISESVALYVWRAHACTSYFFFVVDLATTGSGRAMPLVRRLMT